MIAEQKEISVYIPVTLMYLLRGEYDIRIFPKFTIFTHIFGKLLPV